MMLGPGEREIARVWKHQLLSAGAPTTEEGEPVEVIEPGWQNDDRGPDFKDAVLRLGRSLVRGDVEIHVRSNCWWEHGHHLDAVYDRVVLHVVMWHDAGTPARLSSGGHAQTLVLRKNGSLPLSTWAWLTPTRGTPGCRRSALHRERENEMLTVLDEAGDERFHDKASRFGECLDPEEAGQRLYEGVMGALGYSRNKLPFLELARLVPLQLLERLSVCGPGKGVRDVLQALLGASGLPDLPCQLDNLRSIMGECSSNEVLELADIHRRAGAMSPQDWNVLKTRPNNSPAIRLAAVSHLLQRFRERGLLEGLVGLVRESHVGKGGHGKLEAGLAVSCGKVTLLGRSRAADIAVNVLLPFAAAWGRSAAEPGLSEKAVGFYRFYPRLAENSVERHMTVNLALDRRSVNSARRQQGLIRIYRNYCSRGECDSCPLCQTQAGNDVHVQPADFAGAKAEVAA